MKNKLRKLIDHFCDYVVLRFFNPYKIEPGGNCPVQAEGNLPDGSWYYFRSRGTRWSLEVYKSEDEFDNGLAIFNDIHTDYKWPEAGWIPRWKAVMLATKSIRKYFRTGPHKSILG
jgi:hypothetical protein